MVKRKLTKAIIAVAILFASASFYSIQAPVLSSVSCHAANIFYEARGETQEGMKAIAAVVINRKNSGKYSSTDCEVIFQKNQFSWTHQQKFKDIQKVLQGDISDLNQKDRQAYLQARLIAQKAVKGRLEVLPKGALWYHATYAKPRWSSKMKLVKTIGRHVFYTGR